MYLALVRISPFYREFGVGLLVRLLTSWEMCGLSGKTRANFEEFTLRFRIVDHGATVLGL